MKILIIEDEEELMKVMRQSLEKEMFIIEEAFDFQTALDKIISYDYDCILLDIMLPDGNGLDLLEEIKKLEKKEAIIIISAKDSVEDRVRGLNLGADDYLIKPFHLAELCARVKSAIRRRNQDGNNLVNWNNVTIDPEHRTVYVSEQELVLNRKEFDLFYYFIVHSNRLIHKTSIAEHVWGDQADQADNLDFVYSQVKNLRKKLKDANAEVNIQAVYGIGYKIV